MAAKTQQDLVKESQMATDYGTEVTDTVESPGVIKLHECSREEKTAILLMLLKSKRTITKIEWEISGSQDKKNKIKFFGPEDLKAKTREDIVELMLTLTDAQPSLTYMSWKVGDSYLEVANGKRVEPTTSTVNLSYIVS